MSLCRLESTDFTKSDLRGAYMIRSMLHFPKFMHADLTGLNLSHAKVVQLDFGGLSWAKALAVFVEGAEIRSIGIVPRIADKLFGSRDTETSYSYREAASLGMTIAETNILFDNEPEELEQRLVSLRRNASPAAVKDARMFQHWNPYSSSDLAAGPFRDAFIAKHGLRGWPYDET